MNFSYVLRLTGATVLVALLTACAHPIGDTHAQ